jgi:hypothetical protein
VSVFATQREDAVNYLPGHVIEFHRRALGGFKCGEQWHVIDGLLDGRFPGTFSWES